MQVHILKTRFPEAFRDVCKIPIELYILEGAIMQVETDRWSRKITDQDITLLQITFTDPVLAQE